MPLPQVTGVASVDEFGSNDGVTSSGVFGKGL